VPLRSFTLKSATTLPTSIDTDAYWERAPTKHLYIFPDLELAVSVQIDDSKHDETIAAGPCSRQSACHVAGDSHVAEFSQSKAIGAGQGSRKSTYFSKEEVLSCRPGATLPGVCCPSAQREAPCTLTARPGKL
jgi:hypothetical protein